MEMDELCEEMKAFLRYVGLDFHQKDKVQVSIEFGKLKFSYGRSEVYVNLS